MLRAIILSIIMIMLVSCGSGGASKSTFSVRIDNVVAKLEQTDDDRYSYTYKPYLVMENMPAGEYVISKGGCFSHTNPVPNENDYCVFVDGYDSYPLFTEWDWSQPLIFFTFDLTHQLLPARDYYFRGVVETNKGVYYTNIVTIRSEKTAPLAYDPTAYEIPVIFHVPANSTINYKERVADWLEYANMVFSNYYGLPHLADANIRFVPARYAPNGALLETPGLNYYTEQMYMDAYTIMADDSLPIANPEDAVNVWICPFYNIDAHGISILPYFDLGEVLPGAYEYELDPLPGILINDHYNNMRNDNSWVFAHEIGHFLGLLHVFEDGDDYCSDTPFYDRDEYVPYMEDDRFLRYDTGGNEFLSDNIMDYDRSYFSGISADQNLRIQHTLDHAYYMPGLKQE